MTDVVEGGCACGAIRYRITGGALATAVCHCRSCRRASGAPSVAWTAFRRDDLAFTAGLPAHHHSSPPVVRTFCARCGTPLTYQHDDSPDTVDVTTATLDAPERFPPTRELWLEHRIPWVPLDDSLRHYGRSSQEEPSNDV